MLTLDFPVMELNEKYYSSQVNQGQVASAEWKGLTTRVEDHRRKIL